MNETLQRKLENLPESPGVYLMKNSEGEIIYVGKAIVLKNRVSQYFSEKKNRSPKEQAMIKNVADLELRLTSTETEALILECKLIKQFRPRYNILLKDDKAYPFIRLTLSEKFPRVMICRRRKNSKEIEGDRYFGAFTDSGAIRENLNLLRKIFPLRTCKKFQSRPCLEHHLNRCAAPCAGKISEADYQSLVDGAIMFLEGKTKSLEEKLRQKMLEASDRLNFELAAKIRDQIAALKKISEQKQIHRRVQKDQFEIQTRGACEELGKFLQIPTPFRMECFDISHNQGSETVASMVVFEDGLPRKSDYRRFKIKTTEGSPDDFRSMREVIARRYSQLAPEDFPNLIVIDGGIGQLNSALEILRGLEIRIPTIGLAKRLELVFTEGSSEPLELPRRSQALYLLQRIRDEAHRFAITYHRLLRGKRNLKSILDSIEGIGKVRRSALRKHFATIDQIRKATIEELLEVEGMNRPSAESVFNFFHKDQSNDPA